MNELCLWVVDKRGVVLGPLPAEALTEDMAAGGVLVAVCEEQVVRKHPPDEPLTGVPIRELTALPFFQILTLVGKLARSVNAKSIEFTTFGAHEEILNKHREAVLASLPGGSNYPKRMEAVYRRDEPLMKALIEALERGAYLREALEYVGVKRADLQQWLDRAELGYAPYVWFPSAFERGKESAREARGADRPGEVSIRVSLETGEVLRPRTPVGWVYFIQAGAQGPVKIGFAEKSVARRLGELQVAHFEKLRLLGAVRADQGAEQEIHALFEDARVQGEWFALSEGLQRVLTELPRLSKFECTPVQIVAEIGRVATSVSG